jgi:hypothetical protein
VVVAQPDNNKLGPHHPYTLEVKASRKPDLYEWLIRKNGKLIERSDREYRSEEDARRSGEKAIERAFAGDKRDR